MEHRDADISDIVVVLDDCKGEQIEAAVVSLRQAGVAVEEVDAENGVVEGTIESSKVESLKKIAQVKYVRSVFNYVADYPVGDPRNNDESDRDDENIPR